MSSLRFFSITLIVFSIKVFIHLLQLELYSGNFFSDEINTIAYSIYIPHGWRILSFLIYGYWAIPGLFLAHFVTGYYYDDGFIAFDLIFGIMVLIAVFCVPLAGIILKKFFVDLKNFFIPSYIICLTILSAFINASLVNLIRLNTRVDYNLDRFFPEFFGYFVGDTLGVLLVVIAYIGIRRLFYLSVQKT